MIRLWVCQVRREAFVGGESQRCRHAKPCKHCRGSGVIGTYTTVDFATGEHRGNQDILCATCNGTGQVSECGVMELIGGEPIDYCVRHSSPGWSNSIGVTDDECYEVVFIDSEASGLDCLFESQIRVGP